MDKNKHALIIGGSSGIGLATVEKMASSGFNIILIHRDGRQSTELLKKKINELKEKYQVEVINFNIDATNSKETIRCTEEIKELNINKIDLIVHSISRGHLKPFFSPSNNLGLQDLEITIQSMGLSLHTWVSTLLEKDLIQPGSRIVALTSEGNKRIWEGYGAVALAKSTLETMAKYFAVELAPRGITTNIIQPGITNTNSFKMIPNSNELIAYTEERNPNKRLTNPQDVANAIFLLTLPEANWINGSILHVDGGEHLV